MSTDSFVTPSKLLELLVVYPRAEIKTWKYLRPKYKSISDTCSINCWPHLTGKHPQACHSTDCRQSKAKYSNSSVSRDILSETFCTIIFYNLTAFVYLIISPFRFLLQILLNLLQLGVWDIWITNIRPFHWIPTFICVRNKCAMRFNRLCKIVLLHMVLNLFSIPNNEVFYLITICLFIYLLIILLCASICPSFYLLVYYWFIILMQAFFGLS